ncbi:MAG: 4Fe-4S binding protein [Oscillospiraceae bacterium]|nr:4Fe-4S binding protein [Oscillospiraceae bacterium]
MKEKLKKWIPSRRKIIQLYCALLFNANLKGFISGNIYTGSSKQFCVPGINCYSCPGAIGACPLGSLQGSFSADHSTIWYVGGILLLYSIMFGRMICGWFCPFGLIQELLYKIKTPKMGKSPVTRILSYLKYVILVVFVFLIPIIYAFKDTPLPAFCKYICPAGTIEGGLLLLSNKVNASYFSMLGPIFTWKFLLMISTVVGCVFIFRLFCRFLCPLGALYGLFNKISFFGVKVDDAKCTHCNLCVSHCKVDIHRVGDQECISCGDCIGVCPTKAISFKGSKVLLKENEIPAASDEARKAHEAKMAKRRTITRAATAIVMAAVLIFAIGYYWMEDSAAPASPVVSDTERGNEVGDLCYSDNLRIITPDGITEETIDPTATGKITVINFWGTWCTPCVNELPYFDQIATDYAENVTVVAVHSSLGNETAPEYIGKYYADSNIIFATDYALDEMGLTGGFYSALGGRGTYPYTTIVDENGIILAVFVSSVAYEDLQEVVEARLNG